MGQKSLIKNPGNVWEKVFAFIRKITGNVDISKGTLQEQIDAVAGKIDEWSGSAPGDIGFTEGIEADNVIDAINEVFQSGNEKKNKLVENLVAMGIEASTDETWEALLGKLESINIDCIRFLGNKNSADNKSGRYEYDIKALYPDDYMNFTKDDFIVGVYENSGVGSQVVREPGTNVYGRADGFSLNVTYDADTGILSITNFVVTAYIAKYVEGEGVVKCNNPGSNSSVVFAYLIAGAKLFKNVVDTTSDTVTEGTLLSGYTAHNAAGEPITGALPDKRATTVDTAGVTYDDDYTYLALPEGDACYNGSSKVRTRVTATAKSLYFPVINLKTYDPSATPNNCAGMTLYVKDYTTVTIEANVGNVDAVASSTGSVAKSTDGGGTYFRLADPVTIPLMPNTPIDIRNYDYLVFRCQLGRYSAGYDSGNGYGDTYITNVRFT